MRMAGSVAGETTVAMERAGWSEDRIRNILGLNWLRLLGEVWDHGDENPA